MIKATKWVALAAAVMGVAIGTGKPVHASPVNLVTNPGFETGDFTGYALAGDPSHQNDFVGTSNPHTNTFAAQLGNPSGATLFQVINTTAGDVYQVSFYLALLDPMNGNGTTPNTFQTSFGNTLGSPTLTDAAAFGYTLFTFNATASSASEVLAFTASNTPAFYFLDDVSVVDITNPAGGGTPTATPEPSTIVSASIAGLMGLGYALRRHKARSAA